jgi:hypothetical protein
MPDCPHQFQIGVSAGFDPLPDRKGFRYSRPATSVKLGGEMLVVRVRHRLSGDLGASLAVAAISHQHSASLC